MCDTDGGGCRGRNSGNGAGRLDAPVPELAAVIDCCGVSGGRTSPFGGFRGFGVGQLIHSHPSLRPSTPVLTKPVMAALVRSVRRSVGTARRSRTFKIASSSLMHGR